MQIIFTKEEYKIYVFVIRRKLMKNFERMNSGDKNFYFPKLWKQLNSALDEFVQ